MSRCLLCKLLGRAGWCVAVVLCASALFGVGAGRADTGPNAIADASKQLAAEVRIGPYGIRPPLGYTPITQSKDGMNAFGWSGTTHPNGVKPAVYIVIATVPPDDRTVLTLTRAVESVQKVQRKYEPDATFTKAQEGTVNGIVMARLAWTGHDTRNVLRQGVIYCAIDGRTILGIGAQDADPYSEQTVPLMETSILTFRRIVGR